MPTELNDTLDYRCVISAWGTEIHRTPSSAQTAWQRWADLGHLLHPVQDLGDGTGRVYFVYRTLPGYWNGRAVANGTFTREN
jgi:hypothetical protein